MAIITWIIFGAIVGFVAELLVGGREGFGCLASIIIGMIGSFVGNTLVRLLQTGSFDVTGVASFDPLNIIVSVVGAIIFVALLRMARGGRD